MGPDTCLWAGQPEDQSALFLAQWEEPKQKKAELKGPLAGLVSVLSFSSLWGISRKIPAGQSTPLLCRLPWQALF